MRRLIALALAVAACRGERQASSAAPGAAVSRGPDHVVLRIPRAGGLARAYIYPRLDSVTWAGAGAPAVSRVLAFDPDGGVVAVIDAKGQPRRIDLRATEIRLATRDKLSAIASANGNEIYGVTEKGMVSRMTPSGDWSFEPPAPARWVFPQPNGSVVIASNEPRSTRLWLIRPTDDEILENASLPLVGRSVRTQVADRLYFTVDSGLIGVETRNLSPVKSVRLRKPVQAVAATPSGDRLYVALRDDNRLSIVNRYTDAISATLSLPGPVSELRMDPLGQQILAKPAAGGDSAWVISVGTTRVAGSIPTEWRTDLPAFGPGATIVTVRGNDVVFVSAGTLGNLRTVSGGASDFWYFFTWNGFRPRSADLDRPVIFETRDSAMPADSPGSASRDSGFAPPLRDATPSMIEPTITGRPPVAGQGFVVSFAAVLTQQKASEVAAGILVNGMRPRVAPAQSGSTTIYRVVLGPYATRDEAERVGRDSGRQYWVYEGSQ